MTTTLTLLEAEHIAHQLAIELLNYSQEPIPPFDTRYPHKLESCLSQPFQSFGGNELYDSLYDKAAVLFYLVIKNHPFRNGNKRMAVTLTLTFLYKNNYFLEMSTEGLYNIAVAVAEIDSSNTNMEATIESLEKLFKEKIVPIENQ